MVKKIVKLLDYMNFNLHSRYIFKWSIIIDENDSQVVESKSKPTLKNSSSFIKNEMNWKWTLNDDGLVHFAIYQNMKKIEPRQQMTG